MTKDITTLISKLEEFELEIYRIKNIISVLYVDIQSTCPEDGKEERGEQLSYLTGLLHEKVTAPKFQEVVEEIKNHPSFSTLEQEKKRKVELWNKEIIIQTKLPSEFVQELETKRYATNTL